MSGLASSFCRNTPPTSTPSSRSSPSSKLCCERRKREATRRSPTPAAKSSPSTRPPNAPHTSRTQDTRRPKSRTLLSAGQVWRPAEKSQDLPPQDGREVEDLSFEAAANGRFKADARPVSALGSALD